MTADEKYMQRCLELAAKGAGYVAPNPMVGAVLVHEDRIIGEGFHQKFGGPHAEVNCIQSVKDEDKKFISSSVMYVSLEPCSHFGKTPPCTDLIIENKIPRVVIGNKDPFAKADGRGIQKLRSAGITVETGVLESECTALNKRFILFHTQHRPYIILKWAQTSDGKMAAAGHERLLISHEETNRLVHKWRSEEAAILVGKQTALKDNPELTTRHWQGPSPVRMVVDMDLALPASLHLFNGKSKTIVFNTIKHEVQDSLVYWQVTADVSKVHQVCNALYQMNIQSVMVEGGARLLQSFIDENMWDEARIITNKQLAIGQGLPAPEINHAVKTEALEIASDTIEFFIPLS